MAPLLEIACFSAESAIIAWRAGAQRIELCLGQEVGGTTPTIEAAEAVKATVNIPVHIMIRPRGGSFVYSDSEFEAMRDEIARFRPLVDGFVFGILESTGKVVDVARTAELVRLAAPLPCTFHRAIDETLDLPSAVEDVVRTGCEAILTSGGAHDAVAGAAVIGEMIASAGGRLNVIPGGGVRASNLEELRRVSGAVVFHSSGLLRGGSSEPDADEIRAMRGLLDRFDAREGM